MGELKTVLPRDYGRDIELLRREAKIAGELSSSFARHENIREARAWSGLAIALLQNWAVLRNEQARAAVRNG